jgi:hypothetical protein
MRARMSDPDKRERWLSYMETHYTATVEETGVTPEDWVLNMAWGEARSILADVERMPAPEDGGSAVYLPHAIYCDIARARDAACFVDERTILAESLRSFVEGN